MKNWVWILFVSLFLSSCSHEKSIIFINNENFSRTDEPVILTRNFLDSLFRKEISSFFPLVRNNKGDTIPSQTDDLNGDGKWDELFLLCDFAPGENKEIRISLIDPSHKPLFRKRANIRFAKTIEINKKYEVINQAVRLKSTLSEFSLAAFQMEGPAWESDKIAFRNYFDARNGIDIYGKITSRMALDSIGTGENYHNMLPWGMDILHVGTSLGAGALGMLAEDTLFRLDLPESGGFESVSRGPLRVILRLTYKNWLVKDKKYDLLHEISTWGGLYGYQSKVTLTGSDQNSTLVSGIVNIHSDTLYVQNSNALVTVMYTHDKQAFNGDYLGLGLILMNKDFIKISKAPKEGTGIIQTYLAQLKAEPAKPVTFRFYAGWEKTNKDFGNAHNFGKFLEEESLKMSNPILIKVK
jgi:hypothetical protein